MYCWNCGKEVDENVRFCPHCGMKQAQIEQPSPQVKDRKGIMIPVICAAICAGALLGMVLLLAGNREEPESPAQISTAVTTVPRETQKVTTAPEETQGEPQPENKVDPQSVELPDLASFLNTRYTQDEWGYTHYVTTLIDRDKEQKAVQAVLDLLQEPRYQLKQMDRASDSEGTHYTFEYTGKNPLIDWVYLKAGGQYHAKLTVKPYGSSQTALILYTYPEFCLEDPGTRWDGSGSSSGSSDSGGSSGSSGTSGSSGSRNSSTSGTKIQTNCTRCFGSGEVSCSNCSGVGYKVKRESVPNYSGSTSGSKWSETKETCYKCHGSGEVTCSRCGGSGKQ